MSGSLGDRTPVVVGVGEVSEQVGAEGYRRRSPADLGADAARAALQDTGADPAAVAAAIDTLAGIRQFETSFPGLPAPFGCSDNYPRSVAGRIGADPRRAILEVVGGHAPQKLVTELSGAIAAGDADVALVVGAEAISTVAALRGTPDAPDWTETAGGQLEDRGYGLDGIVTGRMLRHGLTEMTSHYALLENARRARLGLGRDAYARAMAQLFAPFSAVAARNPHAAARAEVGVEDLATTTDRNRMVADPLRRLLIARDKVNQGAAVLLASAGTARRLGVPQDRWVYLHGHADLVERPLLERPDLGTSPAAAAAAGHALELAGIGVADLASIDLYSCYPIAVFALCDALGLDPADPRGLTVTGGLPFFGGPGNNYSSHGIARSVQLARAAPGSFALVGANGGALGKYSAGVLSTAPAPWRPDRSAFLQADLDARPRIEEAETADGTATIETFTVRHDRGGRTGIVVGRLPDGRRVLARTAEGDEATLELLGTDRPFGETVKVRAVGEVTVVSA